MSGTHQDRGVAAEYGLVCAWFAVSLIMIGCLAFFSASMRDESAIRSVNGFLEKGGEPRRLSERASNWGAEGRAALAGPRFSLDGSTGGALIFTITAGGVVANCVALIDEEGRVDAVLPMGSGSSEALRRLPAGLIQSYISRIEESERMVRSREKRK